MSTECLKLSFGGGGGRRVVDLQEFSDWVLPFLGRTILKYCAKHKISKNWEIFTKKVCERFIRISHLDLQILRKTWKCQKIWKKPKNQKFSLYLQDHFGAFWEIFTKHVCEVFIRISHLDLQILHKTWKGQKNQTSSLYLQDYFGEFWEIFTKNVCEAFIRISHSYLQILYKTWKA